MTNSSHVIATLTAEGFTNDILLETDHTGQERVSFKADADIDADGANGQDGTPAAYALYDHGTEHLANGGLTREGKIAQPWAREIFILGPDNQPKVFPGGILASTTWYRRRDKALTDPAAYLCSEYVPYIVIPPIIVTHTRGVVRGCRARVTYKGRVAWAVVGDKGPANRLGEISIQLARMLGINPCPKTGGVEKPDLLYELWPGVAAEGFTLQPS